MILTTEQIKQITLGAVRIEERDGRVRFFRFTEEQELLYKQRREDFYIKTFASAGVKLSFVTDSEIFSIKGNLSSGSSRRYYSFDLFIDGEFCDSLNNFDGVKLEGDYTQYKLPMGEFSKVFSLGKGTKNVVLYMPYSAVPAFEQISIDDGAFIKPARPEKKLLVFGDSITQGYDALHPSCRYSSRLAEYLSAEEINKGIGGEVFFPTLAKTKEDFVPDYISVAYGTNDWARESYDDFCKNCREFYHAIEENYPDAKIFAITPIWRRDMDTEKPFGEFKKAEEHIKKVCAELKNATVISGFDFVPKDQSNFADLRLHPNDRGFEYYAESLIRQIESGNV